MTLLSLIQYFTTQGKANMWHGVKSNLPKHSLDGNWKSKKEDGNEDDKIKLMNGNNNEKVS